ncbi:bbs-2 [Pristionchus pacificus]|uniref:Bardet-Biedl syndrome 2 protein homolog n=1 Tax=Pristionchus pacificus TaxID=54126 RepID=A0A2A6BYQ8_PRIPA|nr:bbs-2 [Pristionchus pacificus]|eukprot:PDM70903.1 bbs-2 [Pristionchus pacificus]
MKLKPTFSYSLNSRILAGCIVSARIEPTATKETLIAVSASNKVIIQGVESSLHISDRVRCLSLLPLEDNRDAIVVGTDSHLIVYDAHDNITLFQREVPDGVNCIAIGSLAKFGTLILCGGNCAIWGFNRSGDDVFWTVTGDLVTALALGDIDGDEENELIVGSQDYEIRLFKGDLMREEIIEIDVVISLCHIRDSLYAYALGNGSVGVYDNTTRLWRTKSKVNIASIMVFPTSDYLACVWAAGKIDIRRIASGEDVMKEQLNGELSGAILSKSSIERSHELTIVYNDGKVRGMEMEQPEDDQLDPALLLREFGQKKHNLLVELNNFEQEERVGIEEASEYRIPANTQVKTMLHVNIPERRIELEILADQKVPIRGIVILAEGIFDGESFVQLQDSNIESYDSMIIPIYPVKDMHIEMHVHSILGYPQSDMVNLVLSRHRLPRFSRFALISSSDDVPYPESKVELKDVEIRPSLLADWIQGQIIVTNSEQLSLPIELLDFQFKFVRCQPCDKAYLILHIESGKLTIFCDELEATSSIIQSIALFFSWDKLSSHAVFPKEFDRINKIISDMDHMYEVRDRLGTDISEKHSLLKEMILRAEDSIAIDEMILGRKYYSRLRNVERAVRQDYLIGANNHETLVTSLRALHKMIEIASKLRVGLPSQAVVSACRDAIANENLILIPTIIEFGAM